MKLGGLSMYKAKQFIEDINKEPPKQFRYGVVKQLNAGSRPYVLLDGETTLIEIGVPYLASYTPALNDRVLMTNYNGYVILGKII